MFKICPVLENLPPKMKDIKSRITWKLFSPRPARLFQYCFKAVAGVALVTLGTYILIRSILTVIIALSCEEPLRWFPDIDIRKESFSAERKFNKPYKYLINPKHVCPAEIPIDYLFVVYSAPEYVNARRVIRRTWGNEVRRLSGNRLIFIFGKPSTAELQRALMLESLQHGDIVQENFRDTYLNLTLKTVAMLRWVKLHCPQVRFLVKIDDDTYPNLENFYHAMHGQEEDAIYGRVYHKLEPIRDPQDKWYIPYNELPADITADFITGCMYVIGGSVVDLLYRTTGHIKPFRMEDIYLTGMCAERAGVSIKHLADADTMKLSSLCEYKKAIYGHHVPAEEMHDLWYAMKRLEYKCFRLLFSVHVCYCRAVNSAFGHKIENFVI